MAFCGSGIPTRLISALATSAGAVNALPLGQATTSTPQASELRLRSLRRAVDPDPPNARRSKFPSTDADGEHRSGKRIKPTHSHPAERNVAYLDFLPSSGKPGLGAGLTGHPDRPVRPRLLEQLYIVAVFKPEAIPLAPGDRSLDAVGFVPEIGDALTQSQVGFDLDHGPAG